MRVTSIFVGLALLTGSSLVFADLNPWEDYEPSDAVYYVTTIKVDANMGDAYLEGLRETWIPGNKIAQELGQIEEWAIYRSDLQNSGDFNLILMIKFANTEDLAPNKEEYERFMAEYTQAEADRSTEFAQKNYPAMREITGEYYLRKIEIK